MSSSKKAQSNKKKSSKSSSSKKSIQKKSCPKLGKFILSMGEVKKKDVITSATCAEIKDKDIDKDENVNIVGEDDNNQSKAQAELKGTSVKLRSNEGKEGRIKNFINSTSFVFKHNRISSTYSIYDSNTERIKFTINNVYLPFGVEYYNDTEILNVDFNNKNNYNYNLICSIQNIENRLENPNIMNFPFEIDDLTLLFAMYSILFLWLITMMNLIQNLQKHQKHRKYQKNQNQIKLILMNMKIDIE